MQLLTEINFDRAPDTALAVAVIGYGSQGRAHALNLRDSGFAVRLGLRRGGRSWTTAKSDGFAPMPIEEAVQGADLIALLTPDTEQAAVFEQSIAPHLEQGSTLLFAHGFNVQYGCIDPGKGIDVVMVAPKSPGALVRREYESGRGVPCLFAVDRDESGLARVRVLDYARGLGCVRAGALETTFKEETETDLFGEQAVLCGGATELIAAGFDTLVEAGYQPEVAYFECLHELKLIVDLLYEGGFSKMHEFVSDTAKFGDLTRGPRIVDAGTRRRMREVLTEVQSGAFAREWIAETAAGRGNYRALLSKDLGHPIEPVGQKLRALMPWLSGADEQRAMSAGCEG